jgi:hypothetical protein
MFEDLPGEIVTNQIKPTMARVKVKSPHHVVEIENGINPTKSRKVIVMAPAKTLRVIVETKESGKGGIRISQKIILLKKSMTSESSSES